MPHSSVAFGPPDVVKPTHELLGELLLAQGKAAEAQQEFARAIWHQADQDLSGLAEIPRPSAQAR